MSFGFRVSQPGAEQIRMLDGHVSGFFRLSRVSMRSTNKCLRRKDDMKMRASESRKTT